MVRCTFCGKPGHAIAYCWYRQRAEAEAEDGDQAPNAPAPAEPPEAPREEARRAVIAAFCTLVKLSPGADADEGYDKWCYHLQGLIETRQSFYFGYDEIQLGRRMTEGARRHEEAISSHCERTADTSDSATQTERQPTRSTATDAEHRPTRSTATDAPPTPPARTYAEAAVQTPPAHRRHKQAAPPPGRKEGHRQQAAPPPGRREAKPETPLRKKEETPRGNKGELPTTRAIVMHAAPLKYKPGTMRRWIEEDNEGVKILGIRWLLREDRRGQVVSSLVIYMQDLVEVTKLRMGRRLFRTTSYDWDR